MHYHTTFAGDNNSTDVFELAAYSKLTLQTVCHPDGFGSTPIWLAVRNYMLFPAVSKCTTHSSAALRLGELCHR